MIVVGLMSGTSADGTDAAVVRLDGAPPALDWQVLGHTHIDHPAGLREEIFACFRPATGSADRLCRLNFALDGPLVPRRWRRSRRSGLSPAMLA